MFSTIPIFLSMLVFLFSSCTHSHLWVGLHIFKL
jgi:hypothetical protein